MKDIDWEVKNLDNDAKENIYGVIQEGDGFWYGLNEGYINPEEILESEKQLKELKEAIQVVKSFEQLCQDIAEDFEETFDED